MSVLSFVLVKTEPVWAPGTCGEGMDLLIPRVTVFPETPPS